VCVFLFLTVKSHEMIAIQKDKRVHEQTITTLNRNRRKKTEKKLLQPVSQQATTVDILRYKHIEIRPRIFAA